MSNTHEDLLKFRNWKVKICCDSRYNAYRRSLKCHISSNVCVSMLSLEIIAVNLLFMLELPQSIQKYIPFINALTILLTVFVLMLSLLILACDYSGKKTNFHNCGLALSALTDEIDTLLTYENEISKEQFETIKKKYNDIMLKFNLNHQRKDYLKFKLDEDTKHRKHRKDKDHIKEDSPKYTKDENLSRRCRMLYRLYWNVFDMSMFYWLVALGGAACVCWLWFMAMP